MAGLYYVRALLVVTALVVLNASALVSVARAVPPSEGAPASSETVAQSGNCPAGRQPDGHCLPGGPGNPPARPGGLIHPPVTPPVPPPTMPPGTFPITPPSGRPPATQSQDAELPFMIMGWAKATLHIHDDDHDVTYSAYHDMPGGLETMDVENVPLVFIQRKVQDTPGTTQYVLISGSEGMGNVHVIWKAEGREFDCEIKGKAIVPFPEDRGGMPMDPTENLTGNITEPAYGYLNVVGPDGGDFHSVMIKAFSNEASLIKTCPGDPPLVTKENFQAGFLLHILWQKNTREDSRVNFKGQQTYDMNNPLGLLDMLPPGPNQDIVRQFLQGQTSGSGTSVRYTWKWELFPFYETQ